MSTLANYPAFPSISDSRAGADSYGNTFTAFECISQGMTLRQHYAGLAMQGLLSCPADGVTMKAERIATWAVEQADALLAELDKPVTP